ncbi:hypothetical protein [Nocardioides sp.]|uniref:hypothetical protein n=1 Tax=Nocardioides sp. TaxID=35761 RepID=UPI0035170071
MPRTVPRARIPRPARYAGAWVLAAALAVAVGVTATTLVGGSLRERGVIGSSDLVGRAEIDRVEPDPQAAAVSEEIAGRFGAFPVTCRGFAATATAPRPAPGWRTVSFEQGPDDDVDAVFVSGRRSIEIEVYCNRGRPRLGETEEKVLPSGAS